MVVNMPVAFYGLNMHPYMELIQMILKKKLVLKYISYDVSLLPITLQNAKH
jgi:hypothetical protein